MHLVQIGDNKEKSGVLQPVNYATYGGVGAAALVGGDCTLTSDNCIIKIV